MCEAAARDINVKLSELLKLSSMYKERGLGVASTCSISPASGVAGNLPSRLNGLRTIYLLPATDWSNSIHAKRSSAFKEATHCAQRKTPPATVF